MPKQARQILYWSPRVLSLVVVWLAAFGVFLGLLFVLNWKYRAELCGGPPPTRSH
jgi:hypothetical protein